MGRLWTALSSANPRRLDELQRLDTAVRAPLALSTRVGFVGVVGGTGCSTVAGLTASVLASRRAHRVLAVNASQSPRSLLWHTGLTTSAQSTPDQQTERRGARHSEQATAGLARTPNGLYCLDLYSEDAALEDAQWWDAVAPSGRFFDFVLTDWGVREPVSIAKVTSASSIVCVVAAARRDDVQRGLDLAHALEDSDTTAVLAIVDTNGGRPAAIGDIARLLPMLSVEFGHDPAHGAALPVPSTRLRAPTNLSALRLAAALVGAAAQPNRRPRKVA